MLTVTEVLNEMLDKGAVVKIAWLGVNSEITAAEAKKLIQKYPPYRLRKRENMIVAICGDCKMMKVTIE